MRNVIFLLHLSLDGYVAGPNGEMDWIGYSDEMERYSHELHRSTDAAIYGRVTYQMMESYFPALLNDPASQAGDLAHARWLDAATKIVFSRTLESVQWQPSLLIHDHIAEEVAKLKQQPGKDIWLIGSPSLAHTFMELDLIDEYRFTINPMILGSGKKFFGGLPHSLPLKLVDTTVFQNGVTALRYVPANR
ncbi:MAG: dihydrofolate reductase [Ktedonobacterales bacterium]|nr:dihydrofolate reductase [Ktedonobacterales bacterium]